MNIYKVYVDNELTYEDYYEEVYIIAAYNEKQAERIGLEMFDNNRWQGYGKKSFAKLLTHTNNGFEICLKLT